jgi:hypothetical protein
MLQNRFTDGGDVVNLMHRPQFISPQDSWYSFRLEGHSAAGRIRSIEKYNDLIGNRTRDLQVCTIVINAQAPRHNA